MNKRHLGVMPTRPELERLLKESAEKVQNMTPEQREEMVRAQCTPMPRQPGEWVENELFVKLDAEQEAEFHKAIRPLLERMMRPAPVTIDGQVIGQLTAIELGPNGEEEGRPVHASKAHEAAADFVARVVQESQEMRAAIQARAEDDGVNYEDDSMKDDYIARPDFAAAPPNNSMFPEATDSQINVQADGFKAEISTADMGRHLHGLTNLFAERGIGFNVKTIGNVVHANFDFEQTHVCADCELHELADAIRFAFDNGDFTEALFLAGIDRAAVEAALDEDEAFSKDVEAAFEAGTSYDHEANFNSVASAPASSSLNDLHPAIPQFIPFFSFVPDDETLLETLARKAQTHEDFLKASAAATRVQNTEAFFKAATVRTPTHEDVLKAAAVREFATKDQSLEDFLKAREAATAQPQITINVYLDDGVVYSYTVNSPSAAREHASAIIKTGYRHTADGELVHFPPHRIFKVKANGAGITTMYHDSVRGT